MDLKTVIIAAVIAVGIIQWLKQSIVKLPTWVANISLPLVSVAIGFASAIEPLYLGLAIWAVSELSYPLLVKLPNSIIAKMKSGSE